MIASTLKPAGSGLDDRLRHPLQQRYQERPVCVVAGRPCAPRLVGVAVVVAEVSTLAPGTLKVVNYQPDFEFWGPGCLEVLKLLKAKVAAELFIRYVKRRPDVHLCGP
jgi:hypothetical protein